MAGLGWQELVLLVIILGTMAGFIGLVGFVIWGVARLLQRPRAQDNSELIAAVKREVLADLQRAPRPGSGPAAGPRPDSPESV